MNLDLNFFTSNLTSHPHLAHIILRTLAVFGPMPVTNVVRMVRPTEVVRGGIDAWTATLDVLVELDAIRIDGDVTLEVEFIVGDDRSVDVPRFQGTLRRQLVKHSIAAIESGRTPSDLGQGLFWLSLLAGTERFDSSYSNGDESPEKLLQRFGLVGAILNQERWRAFLRWASALGFLRTVSSSDYTVDYTDVVKGLLPEHTNRLPLIDFRTALNEQVLTSQNPVVAQWFRLGGRDAPTGELPKPVSWALARLRSGGLLSWTLLDDARGAVVIAYSETRVPASHLDVRHKSHEQ